MAQRLQKADSVIKDRDLESVTVGCLSARMFSFMERVEGRVQVETGLATPYADPKTHRFLIEAIAEGAHLVKPKDARAAQFWARARNLVGIYYGTDKVMVEIGEMMGLTAHNENKRKRPKQIINKFIRRLHAYSSPALQRRFPLEEIKIGKPLKRSELAVDRRSAALGSRRAEIRQMVASGLTSHQEIVDQLGEGVSRKHVTNVLARLRKRGLAPESRPARNKRILEQAKKAKSNQEISAVFAEATYGFMKLHPDLFLSLMRLARRLGYRFVPADFVYFLRVLEKRENPFDREEVLHRARNGKLVKSVYYFVLKQQEDSVAKDFDQAPELKRFFILKSASQVAGPEVKIPSCARLHNRKGYRSIMREVLGMGVSREELFAHSPVPIFRDQHTFAVRDVDYKRLIAFAKKLTKASAA